MVNSKTNQTYVGGMKHFSSSDVLKRVRFPPDIYRALRTKPPDPARGQQGSMPSIDHSTFTCSHIPNIQKVSSQVKQHIKGNIYTHYM